MLRRRHCYIVKNTEGHAINLENVLPYWKNVMLRFFTSHWSAVPGNECEEMHAVLQKVHFGIFIPGALSSQGGELV